jgi:hypothetical protein
LHGAGVTKGSELVTNLAPKRMMFQQLYTFSSPRKRAAPHQVPAVTFSSNCGSRARAVVALSHLLSAALMRSGENKKAFVAARALNPGRLN